MEQNDSHSTASAETPAVANAMADETADKSNPNQLPTSAPDDEPPYGALSEYNPDDYRWVPVRRVPRRDGWTEEKQRRFIEMLADTGLVGAAAKSVGLTRESAYRLRRSPHGAAFARAWDAARAHAGAFLEDVAFERAIEGVEHNVYDENGDVVCTKRVHNDRLLTFLLRHLKPERYGDYLIRKDAQGTDTPAILQASLLEMEPQLPAPVEELIDPETLEGELEIADIADGKLPHFMNEQRPEKSPERIKAEEIAAQNERGRLVFERGLNKKVGETFKMTRQDMIDEVRYLDPASRFMRSKKRYR